MTKANLHIIDKYYNLCNYGKSKSTHTKVIDTYYNICNFLLEMNKHQSTYHQLTG